MKSSVVIGANWGDEGKGLITDYLCKKYNADLVVRFNGGAQAGHTVVTPEGKRHVFSHIGSGFFLGVPTYLTKDFILNPIAFKKEYTELNATRDYKIFISYGSLVTTYWDMLANRAIEEMREGDAHGSCGLGINATIGRSDSVSFTMPMSIAIATTYNDVKDMLTTILRYWQQKLTGFSKMMNKPIPEWVTECFERSDEINMQFIDDLRFMLDVTEPSFFSKILTGKGHMIFEGAQGLALDQFYGNYPYVTRSNTGMRNVVDLLRKNDGMFSIDEIVYVSRTYETRHGNDPAFSCSEQDREMFGGFIDKTNIRNDYQGELRYRELAYPRLANRARLDLEANNLWPPDAERSVRLALTHADQLAVDERGLEEFKDRTGHGIPLFYEASGETRDDVKADE